MPIAHRGCQRSSDRGIAEVPSLTQNTFHQRRMSATKPNSKHPWLRGVIISAAGVIIGATALVSFCYSLGLNFQDEGWGDNEQGWQTNRPALFGSLVGFALAILVFWLGFFQTTNSRE